MKEYRELTAEEVYFDIAEDKSIIAKTEQEVPEIIGQPRALKALQIGTEIKAEGYNIFVTGKSGTGRQTAVRKVLEDYKPDKNRLKDIAFVYNFKNPDSPGVLYFQPGKAGVFKKEIHDFIEEMKKKIKLKLDSDVFKKKRDRIIAGVDRNENKVLSGFKTELTENDFQLINVQSENGQSSEIVPLFNGIETDFDELQTFVSAGKIKQAEWNSRRDKYHQYIDRMKNIFQDLRADRQSMEKKLTAAKEEIIKPLLIENIKPFRKKYSEKKILAHLSDIEADILDNLYIFSLGRQLVDQSGNPIFIRYGINIVLDNSKAENVPVIIENHPTYSNLFGSVETRIEQNGEIRTSYIMIKAGSLIKASGGFLILRADDLFASEDSWEHLKRVLKSGYIEIQSSTGTYNTTGPLLKPEPVKFDVKLIIIGPENLYDILYQKDTDFQKYFKISAEFDSVMIRNSETTAKYIKFCKMIVKEEKLRKLSVKGIRSVIRYGVLLAEHRNRLSTRFSQIADLLKEADYWAGKAGKKSIDNECVNRVLTERKYLFNLPEEKYNKMITDRSILIDVKGSAVGSINGLAVRDRGYYAFGSPCRISAKIAPGDDGIINIEREAGLSGEIHDKGILIIEGYLRGRYTRSFPLSIYASICFEQSYSEIDGDSASSTEIYSLLSAISQIPLRQEIAVTGSVDQSGTIQPVGGITEKVEGFFSICRKLGITGTQGVLIPIQNIENLILSDDICKAISRNRFHIYPISTIDQGMEILSGMKAGKRNRKGLYPTGSINHLVEENLLGIAEMVKDYS